LLNRLGTRLTSDQHRSIGDGHPGTSEEIVAQLRAESQVIVADEATGRSRVQDEQSPRPGDRPGPGCHGVIRAAMG